MWELEIAKIFCLEKKLKKFHRLFLSCNEPINDVKKIVEIGKKDASDSDNHLVPLNGKKKMKEKKKNREENGRKNELDVESSAAKLRVATDLKNKQTKCEWCCACEKCAFIFLLLSAWMPLQGTLRRTYCTVLYSTLLFCNIYFFVHCLPFYTPVLHFDHDPYLNSVFLYSQLAWTYFLTLFLYLYILSLH